MTMPSPSGPPLSRWRPRPVRLGQLLGGLALFGVGEALLVASLLGNSPWTVLGQGVARQLGIGVGAATVLVSSFVLAVWIPLRQSPGIGTLLNAVLIGIGIDATLSLLPTGLPLATRAGFAVGGIGLVGLGSGLYLTTRLGPGPRDGLMTGLHRRTGFSLRSIRTAIELSVTAIGFGLGGTFGVGTVAFAVLIGPAVQTSIRLLGGRYAGEL